MQKKRNEATISSLITAQAIGIKERYLKRSKYTDSYQNKAYKHIKYKMIIGLKLNSRVRVAHRALSARGKHFTTNQQHPAWSSQIAS